MPQNTSHSRQEADRRRSKHTFLTEQEVLWYTAYGILYVVSGQSFSFENCCLEPERS